MKNHLTKFLSIIFPSKCIACSTIVSAGSKICSVCWGQMEFISSPSCAKCDYPFEFDIGHDALCGSCLNESPLFDKAMSVLRYTELSKVMVHRLKYSDKLHIAKHFASLLFKKIHKDVHKFDFIVPVPMHRKKMRSRLYNQAALMATHLSDYSGIPPLHNGLLKTKYHESQTGLSRNVRKENVKNTFAINEKYVDLIKGKNVLLVDDVYTTGATVNECSKILRRFGCGSVTVITLARVV